jgi:hypothetical protein
MNVLQALPKSHWQAISLRTSQIRMHTTSSTSSSLVHAKWLCRNARSMFIARSSSGCMQRVRWFENQREGKSWMLCDIGYSMAGGNNGQEGSHRYKHGTTGGGRKNLNLLYCLSLLAQYMEDHSERLESRAIAHGIKHTSFQRMPELTCHNWDLLQRLDQRNLLLTYCPSKSQAYTALMGDIETRLRRDDGLYDIIDRCSLRRLVASKDCIRVCVPSQALLRKVDPEHSMSLPELRMRVWELGQAFFDGAADGFSLCESIEETLDLYEGFYILEALNKPWGPGAHFKCTCEDC